MKADVCIVGAGAAGLSLASGLSGLDAILIEEHEGVGRPEHCSGLVGENSGEYIARNISGQLIDWRYNRVVFRSASGWEGVVESKRPFVFHVNRPLLEEKLLDRAQSLGHRIITGVRGKPYSLEEIRVGDEVVKCRRIIASDGALSIFKRFYLRTRQDFLIGIQSMLRIGNHDPNTLYIYYPRNNIGIFSWIIPLDFDIGLVGAIAKPPINIDKVIGLMQAAFGIRITGKLRTFGGPVPMNRPPRSPVIGSRIIFHGDSVPLVKYYTKGGLYHIFRFSELLARSLEKGGLGDYLRAYAMFRTINSVERAATNAIRGKYDIPARFVVALSELGLFSPADYDKHINLLLKSIIAAPLLPFFL